MSRTWGADNMGAAQGAVLAHQIRALLGEVRHWQAAHPDNTDDLVADMGGALTEALRAAEMLTEVRSRPLRRGVRLGKN